MMKGMGWLCLAAVLLIVGCTEAPVSTPAPDGPAFTEASFTVETGQKHTVAVMMEAGHVLEGVFSVSGAENTIDFYINGPERTLVFGVIRARGGQSFEVRAEKTGAYTLFFDNSLSFGQAREVSLRYRTR